MSKEEYAEMPLCMQTKVCPLMGRNEMLRVSCCTSRRIDISAFSMFHFPKSKMNCLTAEQFSFLEKKIKNLLQSEDVFSQLYQTGTIEAIFDTVIRGRFHKAIFDLSQKLKTG